MLRIVFGMLALVLISLVPHARAAVFADSGSEFSGTQGAHSWRYGFYNRSADATLGYQVADFTEFDTFDVDRWVASATQVGDNNNQFLRTDAIGGHPNGSGPSPQNATIWAMRRYTSEIAGVVDIAFDLRKINVGNAGGNGVTGHIFVDGVEVYTEVVDNLDNLPAVQLVSVLVALGSQVDFAIDPSGTGAVGSDSIRSARADGSRFSAQIRTHGVPEAGTVGLLSMGLTMLGLCHRPRAARPRRMRS